MAAPKLSTELLQQLELVEPSIKYGAFLHPCSLYPCAVVLKDGRTLDRVYLIEASDFKRLTCLETPAEVRGMLWISVEDLLSIKGSPSRLPARFANEMYRAGESGMGYFHFTVVFSWWPRRDYVVRGLADFIDFPRWRGPSMVKAVLPHVGKRRKRNHPHELDSYWCVFSR